MHRGGKGTGEDWELQAAGFLTIKILLFLPFCDFLLGSYQDHEKELAALFHLWLETKDQTFFKVSQTKINF